MPGFVLSPGSFGFENPTTGEEKKTLWAGAARFFRITAKYQANSSSTSSTHRSPKPLTSCGDALNRACGNAYGLPSAQQKNSRLYLLRWVG